MTRIDLVVPDRYDAVTPGLADVLVDCVAGGAGVGFLAGLGVEDAAAWWRSQLRTPGTLTWVAVTDGEENGEENGEEGEDGERVDGVVQLVPARQQNGPHRAEVVKMLVHRRARGRGLAGRLLQALEREAAARGRWLLVLDTTTGGPAERVYRRLGWRATGDIPDYALDTAGVPRGTTVFSKDLRSSLTLG